MSETTHSETGDTCPRCTEMFRRGSSLRVVARDHLRAVPTPEAAAAREEPTYSADAIYPHGIDADGHCLRCGLADENPVTHECPPGFAAPTGRDVPSDTERLDWLAKHAKVAIYTADGLYPVEHNPFARKENPGGLRADIDAAMSATRHPSTEQGV